jgi:cytochrome c oxidase assembly factor CtaG
VTRNWHAGGSRFQMASSGQAGNDSGVLPRFLRRAQPWPAVAAVLVLLAAVLPPVATYAERYAFAQALQFALFAILTPALLAIGMPPRSVVFRDLAKRRTYAKMSPARSAAGRLVLFIALVITWRLPPLLDALASYPALSVAELVTLAGAGLGVWLAIAGRTAQPLPRPLRAAMAAVAVWTIWIIAYITGMSSLALTPRNPAAAGAISAAADRQLAAAVLWTVAAVCFVPVVYYMLITWLGERDKHEDEQPELTGQGPASLAPARRPAHAWRHRGVR